MTDKEKTTAAAGEEAGQKPAAKKAAPKETKAKKAMATDDIMTAIKSMTVLELSELVKTLEEEFGVSAAVQVAAAPAGAAAPVEEE